MICEPTSLPDVLHLIPDSFPDDRGTFLENYNQQTYEKFGIVDHFVQDNISISKKNVLRGLHFQKSPYEQAKLVSVVSGSVFDVAVDIRPESPTFGKWVGVTLTDSQHNMLYIPKGFAHGFYVLSDEARFSYKCSNFYNKDASTGIRYDDPTLHIEWPLEGKTPILSEQDLSLPSFHS
jgi:dTDP-4-dehydrorhamnose 3,5-epimerase